MRHVGNAGPLRVTSPGSGIDLVVITWFVLFANELHQLGKHGAHSGFLVMVVHAFCHLISLTHDVQYGGRNISALAAPTLAGNHDRHPEPLVGIESTPANREIALQASMESGFHSKVLPVARKVVQEIGTNGVPYDITHEG